MSAPQIALVGSPNSGKTTLFNALTGLRHKVANYAGVTVEQVRGQARVPGLAQPLTLIDLPGIYALDSISPDEEITRLVLAGELPGHARPDAVVVVADATTLARSLPLIGEVLRSGLPAVGALTMIDELKARGGKLQLLKLKRALGVPVIGVVGNKGLGLDDLRHELGRVAQWQSAPADDIPDTLRARFGWSRAILDDCLDAPAGADARTDRIDHALLHPVLGVVIFIALMFIFFQIVFAAAAPLQALLEVALGALGAAITGAMSEGLLRSLLVDGIIGGVGAVLVFVPQITLLLLMIALLEGSGYMARAAFVIDRVMGWAGLEGRCFIALLSSYACAIPGIMATRGVPDARSRLATILVAPLMTCSARLPVYGLLIGAFIPARTVGGVVNLQGLVMFALYLIGSLSALLAASALKRGLLRGRTYPFYMELPPYRRPTLRATWAQLSRGVGGFLSKASRVILPASVVLWALLSFPRVDPPPQLALDETQARAYQLERSYAAHVGHAIAPTIAPLGFDWKIGVALLASLSAREVVVSTLGQIYAFSSEGDDEGAQLKGLGARLRAERAPQTELPAYPLATGLALLAFYVYALQCVSTLAVMRRETNSWRWPALAFIFMTALAYLAALLTRHITLALS